jgi:hypothetical protein
MCLTPRLDQSAPENASNYLVAISSTAIPFQEVVVMQSVTFSGSRFSGRRAAHLFAAIEE